MVEENGLGEGGLLTFMRRQKLGTNSATFLSTYSPILFITCDSAISRKNNELPLTTVATETVDATIIFDVIVCRKFE
jgi:hypothetical protein